MLNRVKRKVKQNKGEDKWSELIAVVDERAGRFEREAQKLRSMLLDLRRMRDSGEIFPGAPSTQN